MMVPRAFAPGSMGRSQTIDFDEKEVLSRRRSLDRKSGSPTRSALSQSLSQQKPGSNKPSSDPVKIPSRAERHSKPRRRPAPSSIQPSRSESSQSMQDIPSRRKESVQDVLSSTTIPIRRKPRQRTVQRLPNCDYVADFSKLLRDDLPSGESSLSGSWTSPQFEGLFGAIDGLLEGQMYVGSEGLDAGILSTRSLSTESMPSLTSPDEYSVTDGSPATLRSPSDHRLRQMASSEDCSGQHPLLQVEEDEDFSGTTTPDLAMSPPPKHLRRLMPEKRPSSFKSSLTASLKALKSAAQTVSNIASTPPLVQPDDFLSKTIFDFQPALTDDRRPPPSDEPPSAALRRYLNPHTSVPLPPDSPAQLHFWVDEKPYPPPSQAFEAKPKLKIRRKYQNRHNLASAAARESSNHVIGPKSSTSQLPPVVPLATCIPSSIRTAHASSPPTWLEPDGTPSNKHRAAQTLLDDTMNSSTEVGQPRLREPRENRDFLRVFVCEMNMRKSGKLSDEAVGHAKLWLPPVDEGGKDGEPKRGARREKKPGLERWNSWSSDDF
ncbi:hypothetical protein LTR99_004855 [Exophiala xenobiotica]|uniref:Uncharacterized protein n=1 Tax=Vermiconidia calcicola TaxID=1690605 RepID=A0AAV9QDS0_9PEZI|nr:hypothetical protein LTR96_008859 [Exophiala xenobiotica]KAK5540135.1 hypothetical protein LTR25_003840 [Vermiconidia calcicola]KAK5543226.1 hypothetical protein LTR23_004989 [Chaetothyriales sp. CCFEE 6169]KAK5304399.1 hypothetical protein LTR99_004855 [Exophiala xenobiotica]KAK5339007.1 hypothetical protein LTR98_005407 [Exophiala xenobiotica]